MVNCISRVYYSSFYIIIDIIESIKIILYKYFIDRPGCLSTYYLRYDTYNIVSILLINSTLRALDA